MGLGCAPLTRAALASTLPISLELHRDEIPVREHICCMTSAAATTTTATSTTVTASAAATTTVIGCQPTAVCHEFIVRSLLDDAAAAQDHNLVCSLHRKEKRGCSMEQNDKVMAKNGQEQSWVFKKAAGRRHCSLSTLQVLCM